MKKFATLVMGLTAVFALTACGKGTKVSEEQFKEKAANIEEHQYSSASVKFSYSDVTKVEGKDDEKEEGKGTIEFTFSDGKWSTTSKDAFASEASVYVNGNLKDLTASADISGMLYGSLEGFDINTVYYTNPFGIESTIKGSGKVLGVETEMDSKAFYSFDKYGFITKFEENSTSSSKLDASIAGLNISGAKTTVVTKTNVTISYK